MHKKGFTLIELLVVISIIGVLSSVVLSSLNSARSKARDTRRKADIKLIQKALEIHGLDKGSYTQPENWASDCSTGATATGGCGTGNNWDPTSDLVDLVTGGYLPSLPIDPINNATYWYDYEPWNPGQGGYAAGGQAYDLCARLEAGGTFCVQGKM